MTFRRPPAPLAAGVLLGAAILLSGCGTFRQSPPPMARPAAFIALGVGAPYLSGDVIGGSRARAAKMRSAKIGPLAPQAVPAYLAELERELRRQTAGIGLDVLRVGNSIVIRIPATLTFDANSSAVKPQFNATLLEIARTVKSRNRTFVDILAHSDLTGSDNYNQTLSEKRATAVAAYLSGHGVAKARIASRGLGESSPLYNPETSETEKAANRRVEIRLVPFTG